MFSDRLNDKKSKKMQVLNKKEQTHVCSFLFVANCEEAKLQKT